MRLRFFFGALVLTTLFVACAFAVNAQKNYFQAVSSAQLRTASAATASKQIKKLSFYSLKESELRLYLAKAPLEFTGTGTAIPLAIPLPNGTLETFAMLESPILSPSVAARHPEIKTYTGIGQTDKKHTIRISFTAEGFNAIVLGIDNDAAYYDKVSADTRDKVYRVYFARDAEQPKPTKAFGQASKCGSISLPNALKNDARSRQSAGANDVGTTFRTFRLAMAGNAEFTAARGGTQSAAFAALVGYVNRVIAVYRVELSVSFVLVSDDNLVYTNAVTDPYSNSSQTTMLTENQTNLDNVIGSANYDIGHVLNYEGSSGGGIASLASLCDDPFKAQGVSGVGDPTQFAPVFDDVLICHEIGHQFGMTHSYNSIVPVCTTREPTTSVEPGSGATIMSYGFTCSDGANNDDYLDPPNPLTGPDLPILNFHTVSFDQAQVYINTLACFTTAVTGNAVPAITQITANRTIPRSTPFSLTATATDANSGDVLSYSWEGTNTGGDVNNPPTVTTFLNSAEAPFFRSYEPVSSGTRFFPRLSAILDGSNTARGDKLPSVGIVTTHRLTVRDNVGGVTAGDVTITIDGNSGPFLETANLAGAYPGNSPKTITWDVANTTAAPVSCATVTILLSTDGGLTFPIVLIANTPNDGSETITFPAVQTTSARIKVASDNNIFFDVSNANFAITAPQSACTGCTIVSVVR